MMQSHALLLSAALLASAIPGTASAADIGSVDMTRVLKESQLGRDAEARLEERFAPKTAPFAEEERAIRQLQQTLERDKPLMSKAQIDKQETEIKDRIAAFEKKYTEIQRELMQAQQEEGRKILAPARDAVNAVARDKKLSAVFESSQSNLLYLDESLDLTAAVIKRMDAND